MTAPSLLRRSLLACTALLLLAAPRAEAAQKGALEHDSLWPPTLETYLPSGQTYDEAFPRPESVLGWPVGTWHVRHDQLVRWFEVVAEKSPRVTLEQTGKTHEARPTLLATISSPANLARIDEIREAHRTAVLTGAASYDGPSVVWMGYGVHGNESSASNASLLLLYHLAAASGADIDAYLERTVVLVDPCVNPDGGARFAHWANMHRGRQLVGDPASREHNEAWPGGRTNHYWFDLNRDWLLLTHPESRGRVAAFHRWMPTVLTDYHEMGSDSTYFFQPGIPSRRNPLTPERNQQLTGEIAEFHAAALDAMGSLYFTEERFDDFYYGKGSTYPDLQGAIGILFEQASSRGHLMSTKRGELTFPFTIRNQFTTSLTTLEAADRMRVKLGAYQREFFRDAREEARDGAVGGYVITDRDRFRLNEMVERIQRHGIAVHDLAEDLEGFPEGESYVIPSDQPQAKLVRALFETRTSWDDNTFYDVSSWTFPLSFDVRYEAVPMEKWSGDLVGEVADPTRDASDRELWSDGTVPAYAFQWHNSGAAAGLAHLQAKGIRTSVLTKPVTIAGKSAGRRVTLDPGAILVPMGPQELSAEAITAALLDAREHGLELIPIATGLTDVGPDLGSGSFSVLREPKPLLLIGSGVSAYEAGEVWHDLDTRVGLTVSTVDRARLGRLDLSGYTHVILVNGATGGWGDKEADQLSAWVRKGGHVIATKRAAVWAAERLMTTAEEDHDHGDAHAESEEPEQGDVSYGEYEARRAEQRIAGTIFEARIDRSHPLGYGFDRDTVPVFRNFEGVLPEGPDPFATPLRYTESPLVSGFASEANVKKIAGTPAVRVRRMGGGTVTAMVDNPCFRGVWYGTRRLLLNAIFFSGAVQSTGPIDKRTEDEAMDYDHGHAHDR
jgi:hypothetical protein